MTKHSRHPVIFSRALNKTVVWLTDAELKELEAAKSNGYYFGTGMLSQGVVAAVAHEWLLDNHLPKVRIERGRKYARVVMDLLCVPTHVRDAWQAMPKPEIPSEFNAQVACWGPYTIVRVPIHTAEDFAKWIIARYHTVEAATPNPPESTVPRKPREPPPKTVYVIGDMIYLNGTPNPEYKL